MTELTPLEQIDEIDAETRKKLAAYWITSAEEFVSTARSSNQLHGSGLKALSVALAKDEAAVRAMVMAALAAAPDAASFSVDSELEVGDGLLVDDLDEVDAASFAPPANLPAAVEPLAQLPPPVSQGVRNSCVAFSLAAIYQVLSKETTDLSEQFLYWACKSRDGVPRDVGTSPKIGMQVLQELGACSEATWPYKPAPKDDTNPGHERPSEAAFAEAKRRRIKGFTQLPAKDFRQIKGALAEGKPVLIGLYIYEFWKNSGQARRLGKLRAQLPGERRDGGHAMCVLGYRDDASVPGGGYFIVRNSWGADWAIDNPDGPGYCHVPYRLVFEQGLAAFAAEGVQPVTAASVSSATGGAATRTTLGGSGEPAGLEQIHAEARELHERLGALVANLGALLGQGQGAATVVTPSAVVPVTPGAGADGQPAELPVAPVSTFSGPLILVAPDAPDGAEELYPNGIDGTTGQPLLRIDAASASRLALGQGESKELQQLHKAKENANADSFGVTADIAQNKIEEARWAVVVSVNDPAALIEAIWPLIQHRMRQMGFSKLDFDFQQGEDCATWVGRHSGGKTLKEHWGEIPPVLLYRGGEDVRVSRWLARKPHGVANGPVDPARGVPFYLMLLGRPGPLKPGDEAYIPLNFQYELDIFYGVGRLCFSAADGQHRIEAYRQYAERVVGTETAADRVARLGKEIVYFGTKHDLDVSTQRSADELIAPLTEWHTRGLPTRLGYDKKVLLAEQATRSNLEQALRGSAGKPPALLFTASHGLGLPPSDAKLVQHQGALVTQDWTGFGSIAREHWFAGEDLGQNGLDGTIAFLFACYGAGCPSHDEFIFDEVKGRPLIAPFPFVAQLPQQLLLNGCLAVLGHVERAWTYSFSGTENTRGQSQAFEDVLGRLVQGHPVGSATDQFNTIQGAHAMALTEELDNIKFTKAVVPGLLSKLWMARNDARNYALLGDPAVRLPFGEV